MANNDEIICINRIKSLYEKLMPAEKLIANYIIAQHETVAAFSCADLAKAAGRGPQRRHLRIHWDHGCADGLYRQACVWP